MSKFGIGQPVRRVEDQRLVTGNPSPAYVYRVAQKFENNGAGVRAGTLTATRLVASGNQRLGVYATQLNVSDSRFYDNGSCGLSGVQGVVQRSIAVGNADYGFCGAMAVVFQTNTAWGNGQGAVLGGMAVAASNVF